MTFLSKQSPCMSFIRHNILSGNECLQHRTVGCVNRTTWRELQALPQFGICDHQDTSSESQKDESHMVPRPPTAQQIAALLQQFEWVMNICQTDPTLQT